MDERFFLYFEDVDWCYRMKALCWRVYYHPSSELIHHYRRQSADARFGKAKRAHLESWLRFSEKWSLVIYLVKRNREVASRIVLLVADVAAVSLAFYLSYLARANLGFLLKKPTPSFEVYGSFMALAVIVAIGSAAYVGLYGRRRIADWIDLLFDVSKAMILASVILMASTFLLYVKIYSRAAVLMFLPISILILTAERFIFWVVQRNLALTRVDVRRILIVGSGALAQKARASVLKGAGEGLELAGFLETSAWSGAEGLNVSDATNRIQEAAHVQRAGEVILADSPSRVETLWPALSQLRSEGFGVELATELSDVLKEGDRIEEMGGLGFVSLKKRAEPGGIIRGTVEFILALLAMVVLVLPALLVAGYLAAAGRRPIFVREEILGEHGETITVRFLNCRRSPASAPGAPGRVRAGDAEIAAHREAAGPRGICAAPLLLSVLAGRIALVGVRPLAKSSMPAGQSRSGKPGIFGAWKLARDLEDSGAKDSEYLANWTVSLDLKTIARCIFSRKTRSSE